MYRREQQPNGEWQWRCFDCSPDDPEGTLGEEAYESFEACDRAAITHALGHLATEIGQYPAAEPEPPSRWEGWTLEYVDEIRTRIKFSKPLGDLSHSEQNLLLEVLGEPYFNGLSSHQNEIRLPKTVDITSDIAARLALFDLATSIARVYFAYKHSGNVISYVDDVSEEEMAKIARSMIAAGIVAVRKK